MLRRYLCALSLSLFVFSCSSNLNSENYTFQESKDIFDLREGIVSPIFHAFSINKVNEVEKHLFVDKLGNLVISSMDSKHVSIVPLLKGEGPDEMNGEFFTPFILQENIFLIESNSTLYLINQYGKLKKEINLLKDIKTLLSELIEDNQFVVVTCRGPHNKTSDGGIIFTIGRTSNIYGGDYPKYNLFFVVRFQDDLEYTIEILDPKFPTIFIENDPGYFDQFEIPSYNVFGDWLYYNFRFSSTVFMYNLHTRETKTLDLGVSDGVNFSLSEEQKGSYEQRTYFNHVLVDEIDSIIYRTHITENKEQPMESINYLNAYTFKEKKLIEQNIGKNSDRLLRNSFIYNGKIFMNNFYPKSDEYLELVKFKLQSQ